MTTSSQSGLPEQLAPRERLLLTLARRRSGLRGIPRRDPAQAAVPASFAQAGLWMAAELQEGASAYNVPLPMSLRGHLDTDALRSALTGVVNRHEALRTTFIERDDSLYQVIRAPAQVPLPVLDLTGAPEEEVSRRLAAAESGRFDLLGGPLLRAELLRLASEEHVLLLAVHHIACDGWSVPLLHTELAQGYNSALQGVPADLAPLPVQYADFACWQREQVGESTRNQLASYWRARLAGVETLLPMGSSDATAQATEGGLSRASIGEPILDRLDRVARDVGASRFMTVAALLAVLLNRYTARRDVLFGSTVTQREHPDLRELIGLFTNVFPIRADLSGNPTFRQLLSRIRQDLIGDYQGSALPFGLLVDALPTSPFVGRTPLVQAHIQLEESDGESTAYQRLPLYDGLTVEGLVPELTAAKFDLNFMLRAEQGSLLLDLIYARDMFAPGAAAELSALYVKIADAVAADPDLGIQDLLLPAPPRLEVVSTTVQATTAAVAESTSEAELETLDRVRRVWQEVLGVDEVPPHADFFDLGGNSFAALKVRRLLGGVHLAELFRYRTAAALAAYLTDGARPENDRLLWPLTADDSRAELTVIAIPYAGGAGAIYQPLADALPPRFRLWATSLPGHEGDDSQFLEFNVASEALVSEIAERVSGAIIVYGHCAGASLAISVAQGLEAQGADLRAVYVGASLTDPDADANLARVTGSSNEDFYTYIKAIGGFNGPLDEADREQVLDALRHDMAGATRFQAEAHAAPTTRLRAPLHCVLGTADPVTPNPGEAFNGWSVFADTVSLQLIDGGGHYFARDRAAELAQIVSAAVPAAATFRLPVICLPHTGAGASFFHPWQVRSDVEIIAPDLAGHDKRFGESPHRTVQAATADLLPRVLAALDGRVEAVLVGHCLGGTVAFELAELLLQHGVRLRHLVISGTPGPTVPRQHRTTGLPDQQFLARLEELAGYAHPALADPEMAALLLPVLRADQEMYENYQRSSVTARDLPITVLRGTEDALVDAADSARWQEATTRPLRYLEVPGGHMYLADDPGPMLELIGWLADAAADADADHNDNDRIEALRVADYPQPDWGLAEFPGSAPEPSYDPQPVPRAYLLAAVAVVLGRYHALSVTVLAVRENAAAERPSLVAFPTDPATPLADLIAVAQEALRGGWPRSGDLLTAMLGGSGPSVEVRFHDARETEYPLTLTADAGLTVAVGSDLISPDAAEHFGAAVVHVAAQLLTESGALEQVEMLDTADRRRLRQLGTGAALPVEHRRIDEIIAATAAGSPTAVAVTDGRIQLTYDSLDRAANRVAHALRELGVEPDDRVGVCMSRGWELIVVLLGVLRAGASYLPMEPDNPPKRLARITRAATPRIVVASSAEFPPGHYQSVTPAALAAIAARQPPAPPAITGDAGDPAYIICTSGSTGTPKPVAVAHRSVTALLGGTGEEFRFTNSDVWALFHSVAFDMSVWEIWGALTTGGRLVVVPHEVTRDPAALHRLLAEERVTVLNQTPTAFGMLVDADFAASRRLAIRLVTFGGEPLDTRALLPWFRRYPQDRCRLVNLYGITETTVHSTWLTVTPQIAETASRSVGVPLPGESLSIRDKCGRLLPLGVPGEIYVGGVGVALGYLGLPDLTAERFLVDPDGTRVYRSGDCGRMLPDGAVEHLGRLDDQVKVRGYRIELGEVRAALLAADGVTAAAVVVGGTPAAARLDAYVTPDAVDRVALRHQVRALLPDYMVPGTFTTLDVLPLTVNGKLDRGRLPQHGSAPEARPASEDLLTQIWEELSGLPVHGDDNIFDVGGNSVVISKFVAQLQARGLAQLALSDVYRLATLRGLADLLASKSA